MAHNFPTLTTYYQRYVETFYQNPAIRKTILGFKKYVRSGEGLGESALFEKIFNLFLEEAELAMYLISLGKPSKSTKILEVGSGLGLVYGYLSKKGSNIVGIEPSASGYDSYFKSALEILKIIGVDSSGFLNLEAKECEKIGKKFDLIVSNNVLEHIHYLDAAFDSFVAVMEPDATMIHNTINYFVPYDPHFRILVFPFNPKLTEVFRPSLKSDSMWQGLNFVTTNAIKMLCQKRGLTLIFMKGMMRRTLERFDIEPGFRDRQRILYPIFKLLKTTKLLGLVDLMPTALTSPIVFIAKKTTN